MEIRHGQRGPARGRRDLCGSSATSRRRSGGQACRSRGEAKCTYGTGAFLLQHTGGEVLDDPALLATAAATLDGEPAAFALEGSIADAGSAVRWLRDGLGIIGEAADVERLAASVPDNGGVYFVPAFSGLFAPRWRSDARGTIVGLTAFTTRPTSRARHARGRRLAGSRCARRGVRGNGAPLRELRVDGGMTVTTCCCRSRPTCSASRFVRATEREATALGCRAARRCGRRRL